MGRFLLFLIITISGFVVGSVANFATLLIGNSIILLPDGINPNDMESLKANLHLFEPKHFFVPFLAHALGTIIGSFIATLAAAIVFKEKSRIPASIISVLFLLGGAANVYLLPSPLWFSIADLLIAYLPMGFVGYSVGILLVVHYLRFELKS